MAKTDKLFEKPANQVEKDIAAFLKPIMTAEQIDKAVEDKKTLSDCFKFTHNKAKPSSKEGVATPSYKQVMTWALEYFGIDKAGIKIPDAPGGTASTIETPPEVPAAKAATVNLDFDSLFN